MNQPYQRFLVAIMTAPLKRLMECDPAERAEKFGVPLDWAQMAIRHEMGGRR